MIDRPRNQYTFVNFPGGTSEASRAELEQATAGFPDAKVRTRQEWIDKEDGSSTSSSRCSTSCSPSR